MTVLRWSLLAAVLFAGMVFSSLTAEPSAWSVTVRWAREMAPRLAADRAPCPRLLTPERARGSREEAYRAATDGLRTVPANASERLRVLLETDSAGSLGAADLELLAAVRPAVDALCAAAASEPGRLDVERLDLIQLIDSVRAAALHARSSPDDRGVTAALAGLTCAVDLTATSCSVYGAVCVGAIVLALDDVWLAALPSAALPRLDAALHVADAALPWATSQPIAHALYVVEFLTSGKEVEPHDIGMASALLAWDHGFSVRSAGMERAIDLVAAVRRFEAESPGDEPWAERRTRLVALERADQQRNSDLFHTFLRGVADTEEQLRHAATGLRLLRLAVAARAAGTVPRLLDPFTGKPFVVERDGAGLLLRGGGGLQRRVTLR